MNNSARQRVALDLAQELLERDVELPLRAFGSSMHDTVRGGDRAQVRRVDPEAVRAGDIVLYRLGDTFVGHRVIRTWREDGRRMLLTKGDGHFAPDPPLAADAIAGRVVAITSHNRVLRLDRPLGRVLTRLLLWHALLLSLLHRLARRFPVTRAAPRALRRLLRTVCFFPITLVMWLWRRTGRAP